VGVTTDAATSITSEGVIWSLDDTFVVVVVVVAADRVTEVDATDD
jgi:hypothetical protein